MTKKAIVTSNGDIKIPGFKPGFKSRVYDPFDEYSDSDLNHSAINEVTAAWLHKLANERKGQLLMPSAQPRRIEDVWVDGSFIRLHILAYDQAGLTIVYLSEPFLYSDIKSWCYKGDINEKINVDDLIITLRSALQEFHEAQKDCRNYRKHPFEKKGAQS